MTTCLPASPSPAWASCSSCHSSGSGCLCPWLISSRRWGSGYKTAAESSHGRAIWATGFSHLNRMPRLPSGPHRRDGRSLVAVAFRPRAVRPSLLPRPTAAHPSEGRKIQNLLELLPIPARRLVNRIRLLDTRAGDSRAELVGAGVGARVGGHFAGVHPRSPRCFGILPADDQRRSVQAPGVGAGGRIDRTV